MKPLLHFNISVSLMLLLAGCSPASKINTIANGFSETSINATIFRKNSIVSHNDFQYVAFYNSASIVTLAKRKLGTTLWEIQQTRFKGNTADAHNIISIMVDGEGYLHMAWDHHNDPLHYCRSISPGSLEMQLQPMIGTLEEKVSYPEFYRLANGNLLFVYRDGGSGNGNMIMNRYDVKTKQWSRIQNNLLDGEGSRNAYWQMNVSAVGTIHLSWVWREHYQVETNHDMAYAVSHDDGITWQTSTGVPYTLPIKESTSEYAWRIPQNSNLINQTSITADANDQPYIATYFQTKTDSCPQYYVIYRNNHEWKLSRVTNRKLDFDLAGAGTRSIPISRPQLVCNKDQLLMIYRDEEYQNHVVIAATKIGDMKWKHREITNYSLDRWEPSYDSELLKKGKLHVYIQRVGQESGERSTTLTPQMVSVLEYEK